MNDEKKEIRPRDRTVYSGEETKKEKSKRVTNMSSVFMMNHGCNEQKGALWKAIIIKKKKSRVGCCECLS